MSERRAVKSFWMIFLASAALVVIVLAIANASLDVTIDQNSGPGVRATFPANTPTNPAPAPPTLFERVMTWLLGFVLTVILSGRFILLVGVLLFYGFVISYIAPNAWAKIRARLRGKSGVVQAEKLPHPPDRK